MEKLLSLMGELDAMSAEGSKAAAQAIKLFGMVQVVAVEDSPLGQGLRDLLRAVADPADTMYRQQSVSERSMAVSTAAALLKTIEDARAPQKPEADLDGHG